MFQLARLNNLNQIFAPLSERQGQFVYFCRIAGYSDKILTFLQEYYEQARRTGVIIDGHIQNPNPQNLSYFFEMMGDSFTFDRNFLDVSLAKWLPRMSTAQRDVVVSALYATFQDMKQNGKNDNMLRNAYTKYMCWLYYKFERIVNQLGAEKTPKILYDGAISNYELQLLTILSRAGADIVLLERNGDSTYLQLDPKSEHSTLYSPDGGTQFPDYFNLKWLQNEIAKKANLQVIYGTPPNIQACTNAWMKQPSIQEMLTAARLRGDEPNFFYNSFILQYGVEDKLTFSSDLFSFYKQLKSSNRRICVVNHNIPIPTSEEIAQIKRKNYTNVQQLLSDLSQNIQYSANIELQRLMVKSFLDVCLEENDKLSGNLLKLTNKAVYLLCWLKRYQKELFYQWNVPEISVFILFGTCTSENEALFIKFLSKLPVDVLVLSPSLDVVSCISSDNLLELKFEFPAPLDCFPVEQSQMRVSTSAYQAERDLDTLLYQDSGLYRNQQYSKADSITLQTMYEEISILWDQELKYRPSFSTDNQTVVLPILLAKICGVKDGQVSQYWMELKKLMTPDTIVMKNQSLVNSHEPNPVKPFATQFLQNKKLLRNKIKTHKSYQYGILRPEIQEHLLDKLQLLLDEKLIVGTYQNGTEYTIISTVLDMNKDILRLIQKFDFTKKNPKLIFINTTEEILSLEDSILVAFLNLIGFDILFFVPTGYQCIEKYFSCHFVNEQQIGEYMYDLSIPNFDSLQETILNPIRKLFRRGF